ncbi:hypothetical protein [Streptomyces clavifer]|uniref:hypothetical protein n=1 Tax=Streptomyces clavifer TaxID=68188 RepID=UPI002381415C|nr:hypothetical protein [Streptomyces clavifer]
MAEESPSLPSDSEHGMPEVDPEAGTPVAGSDTVEEIPRVEIPSPTAPIGKASFVFLPTGHDMSSRPTEKGESSSGPSLLFAKKVLVRVLSSWIETLHSGHLDAGFGMIPHVKEILADTEEVGLDVTSARAIVDRIIALGDKWFETKDFPDDRFFKEMFLDPAMRAESGVDEATHSRKQVVRKRNLEELAIRRLNHELVILEGEIEETKKRLENLKTQVAAKWAAVAEARSREVILISQVADADQVLQSKIEEREKWQTLWSKLPGVEEGLELPPASHGKFLKKRALETLMAEYQSSLGELRLWMENLFG